MAEKKYKEHPLATLIPAQSDGEYGALRDSIKCSGLQQPILVYQNRILDGRHRMRACEETGVAPRFVEWEGTGDPFSVVLGLNLGRRHLSKSQQAMIAAKALLTDFGTLCANLVPHAQESENFRTPTLTAKSAASMFGVSDRHVEHAKKVRERGIPQLIEAVETGEVAVDVASKIAGHDPDTQLKQLNGRKKKGPSAAAKSIPSSDPVAIRGEIPKLEATESRLESKLTRVREALKKKRTQLALLERVVQNVPEVDRASVLPLLEAITNPDADDPSPT